MTHAFAVRAPWRVLLETGAPTVQAALPVPINGEVRAVPFDLQLVETEPRTFHETRLVANVAGQDIVESLVSPELVYRYESAAPGAGGYQATGVSSGGFFGTGSSCSANIFSGPATGPAVDELVAIHVPPPGGIVAVGFVFEAWSTAWLLANEVFDEVPMMGGVPVDVPDPTTIFVGVTPLTQDCVDAECPCPNEPPPREATFTFAQMGEIKWCTDNVGVWKAKIDTLSEEVISGFSDTPAKMTRVHDHCWLITGGTAAANQARAYKCDDGDNTAPDACNFPAYVYFGADRVCTSYMDEVRADIDHSQQVYGPFTDPNLGQVMHFHGLGGFGGTCDYLAEDVCGLGQTEVFAENFHGWGGAEKRSVARAMPAPSPETVQTTWRCNPYVPTHEFGHNFDVDHDGEIEPCYSNSYTCGSVMMHGKVNIIRNYFTQDNKNTIGVCILSMYCGPNEDW